MSIVSFNTIAQQWQEVYQSAVTSFKSEKYDDALKFAEQAYSQAKESDTKSRAYTIQLITASCVEIPSGEKGLSYVDTEIQLFATLEPKAKNHLEAISKKAKLLMIQGKADLAAQTFHELQPILSETKGMSSYEYLKALADEGDAWLQAKKYAEAKAAYTICLPGLRAFPEAGEDYLYTLFNAAFANYQLRDHASASTKLIEFIKLCESNKLTDLPELQQAKQILSTINSSKTTTGTSDFLLAEDQIKKLLQSALSLQSTDTKKALEEYAKCEKVIYDNALVNNTSFSAFLNFSRFLFSLDDFSTAEQKLALAKTQAQQLFKEPGVELAHLQILEGDLLIHRGKKTEALTLYNQSLPIFLKSTKEVANKQVRWIAEQLIIANMPEEAIQVLNQLFVNPMFESLDVLQKITLEKLNADAYTDARKVNTLLPALRQKNLAAKDPTVKQNYLYLIADAEKELGNWNVGLETLQQALKIQSGGMLDAELFYELARLQQQLGNFKEAELAYVKAVETLPTSHNVATLTPQVYNSFATFYIQLGNYQEAEKLFTSLLKNEDNRSSFYNAVRQNFASMYQQTGRYNEAKALLLKTLESDRQIVGENHPDYAITLQNLGALYQKTGKLDSAVRLFERALQIDKNFYGESSAAYATKLGNLGAVYQETGNFQKAKEIFSQSLAIRKKVLHGDHPDYAYNLYNLGFLLYRTNESDKALPYFREASVYYLKQIKDVFPVLSDYERTAFYNKIQEVIQGYEMFMVENAPSKPELAGELLNFRLETKALLLSASIKVRNQILRSGNTDLINKFSAWQNTKEQLAYLYSLTLAERESQASLIAEYKTTANELERWLSIQSETFASSFNLVTIDWKKIQSSLKPEQAALEIMRVKLPMDSLVYAAIVLKAGTAEPKLILFDKGKWMEGHGFRGYINYMQFQLEDRQSFETYWKPLAEALQGTKLLYLSPDGIFNKVNPLTLYDPKAKQYVIENLNIQLASNLKDLLSTEKPSMASTKTALLMGFPDYRLGIQNRFVDNPTTTRSVNLFYDVLKSGVSELPGTAVEIDQIKQTLTAKQWQINFHSGPQALEEKIKEARNPSLVHIATHGFFITPKKSSRQVFGNDLSNIDNNVMLRSGLLLAGAEKNLVSRMNGQLGNPGDDGVLTAFEVMNLNLDQTDLVVLSACETGTGDVRNGEGVYGLQRAFLLAGAKSIIMSLWKVDDAATQFLMTNFYSDWVTTSDRADAFYKTQLEVRKKYPHPYYWGAFVVTGNL